MKDMVDIIALINELESYRAAYNSTASEMRRLKTDLAALQKKYDAARSVAIEFYRRSPECRHLDNGADEFIDANIDHIMTAMIRKGEGDGGR